MRYCAYRVNPANCNLAGTNTHNPVGADAHIGPMHMVRIRRKCLVIGTFYRGAMWASPPTAVRSITPSNYNLAGLLSKATKQKSNILYLISYILYLISHISYLISDILYLFIQQFFPVSPYCNHLPPWTYFRSHSRSNSRLPISSGQPWYRSSASSMRISTGSRHSI